MYSYEYPRAALTADCLLFGKSPEGELRLLLIERGHEPYKGCWALPGGFMEMDETLEQCARRELREETGLEAPAELREVGSFSTVDRDPRGRTVTVAFMGFTTLQEVKGSDDAARAGWFPLDQLPPLAFDHSEILQKALEKLR